MQAGAAMRGLAAEPGFNIADPRLVQRAFELGGPEEGVRIANTQRQLAALQAQQDAQAADAKYHTGMLRLAQAKFPLEEQKLRKEEREVGLRGKKLEFEINKDALDRDAKTLEKLENFGAKVFNTNGRGYDDFRQTAIKEHPEFEKLLPPTYDPDVVSGFIDNAASTREKLKSASEYEYRQVTTPTGRSQTVAIPKRSPQSGAIPVPGTEGVELPNYSFSQGPAGTGTMFAGDPKTGGGYLFTPSQPGAMPQNAMAPPPLLPQTSFTNAPPVQLTPSQGMLAPRARAASTGSVGGATAPLGSSERGRQDVMQQILTAGAYNPDTGVDLIEPTLGRASSGMLSATGTDIARKFGKDSAAARADTDLKRISADLTQAFSGNRLATAGVAAAEADRFEKQAGDIGNSNLTIGERLNAYRSIKRNATRLLGVEYKNPFDPQGIKVEGIMRQRVEDTPEGEFKVTDPEGGVHVFGERKKAAEFLTYMQRMLVGKR